MSKPSAAKLFCVFVAAAGLYKARRRLTEAAAAVCDGAGGWQRLRRR